MTDTTQRTDTRAVVERYAFAGPATWRLFGDMPMRDGKIQAVREYMDTAYATRMLFGGERAAA